jgi:hypothetical protein
MVMKNARPDKEMILSFKTGMNRQIKLSICYVSNGAKDENKRVHKQSWFFVIWLLLYLCYLVSIYLVEFIFK